jgi:hypothetical protein
MNEILELFEKIHFYIFTNLFAMRDFLFKFKIHFSVKC